MARLSSPPASAESRARALWDEANKLLGSKALDEAAAKTEELLPVLREVRAGNVPSVGEAQGLLAHIEHLRSRPDQSDRHYTHAFEFFRAAPEEQNALGHGRALVSYALSLAERDRKDEARASLAQAVDVLRPYADHFDDQYFDLLRGLATRAMNLGAGDVAADALQLGVGAWERLRSAGEGLVGYYGSLASALLLAGRTDDAGATAEKALSLAAQVGLPSQKLAYVRYSTRYVQMQALLRANSIEEACRTIDDAIIAATEAFGAYARETTELHARQAALLQRLNRYRQALPHRDVLLAAAEARSGGRSLDYAEALHDRARVLDQLGDYSQAEKDYSRALELTRALNGENHPEVLLLRFNLAELSRATGDLEAAESELRAVQAAQTGHADLAASSRVLVSLGLTLTSLGKYEEAHATLDEARSQRAQLGGADSPGCARVLLALGQLESARQAFEAAKPYFASAIASLRGKVGWEGMLEAAELGLAGCRVRIEADAAAYDDASALFDRIVARRGATHPSVGDLGRALAVDLARAGAFPRAAAILERCDSATRIALIEALQSRGEQDLRRVIERMRQFQHLHLSLVMADSSRGAASVRAAYEMLVALRGAETTVLRLRGLRFAQSDPSGTLHTVQDLKRRIVQMQLTGTVIGGPQRADEDLARLRRQLRKAEAGLVGRVAEGRLDLQFLTPILKSLCSGLNEDSAVVEFALYTELSPGAEDPLDGPTRYAAFIVRGRVDDVQVVDLGRTEPAKDLIEQYRAKVVGLETDWRDPAAELTRRLFEPLRRLLSGIRQLTVVPEGSLGLLSLGALPVAGGKTLNDEFEIGYAFSSRRLAGPGFEEDFGLGGPAAVFGAPDYGGDESNPVRFTPLEETAGECEDIARLLQVKPSLGAAATEAALAQFDSPEALHVATHGFFLPAAPAGNGGNDSFLPGRASLTDSLDRAGLAFAGANLYLQGGQPPGGGEDGILYASEVAGLRLMRTDLVTLSACQTGVGDVEIGDGVHGLQRAFTTAGARSVVCSLWEVPDKSSRRLFTRFYEELLKGRRRGEALREVVKELAAQFPLHPIAWGGFVLYGDAGVLTRFDAVRTLRVASLQMPREARAGQESSAQMAQRLIDEGRNAFRKRDAEAAIKAFTIAAELADAPPELRARAVYERAGVHRMTGDYRQALADYGRLDAMQDIPARLRASVDGDRGTTFALARRHAEAITAFTKAIDWPGLDVDSQAAVLFNRGMSHAELLDFDAAVADFTALLAMPGAPPLQRAKALLGRAEVNLLRKRPQDTDADAQAVLAALEVEPTEIASAYLLRARALRMRERVEEAISTLRAALAVPGIPARLSGMARALLDELT